MEAIDVVEALPTIPAPDLSGSVDEKLKQMMDHMQERDYIDEERRVMMMKERGAREELQMANQQLI